MPDKSITNREIIEGLHDEAGIRKTDIRPFKHAFEGKGDLKELPPNVERFEDRSKAEVNALVAIFVEDIWLRSLEEIKLRPPGLARITGVSLSNSEISYTLSSAQNSEAAASFLVAGTKSFLQRQLSEWHKIRDAEWKAHMGQSGDLKDIAYNRYVQLLMMEGDKDPFTQIKAGMLTAANTTWGVIKVLPKVYEQQFQEKMPVEKFEKLAKNALHLIYALAGSHLGMFVGAEREYVKTGIQIYDTSNASDFDQAQFDFKDTNGELFLELKPHALSGVEPSAFKDDVRTGCPAIYAIGPSHRNVIAEMYDWEIGLAKKYYLPALEKEQKRLL